jgi:hypothetical protein
LTIIERFELAPLSLHSLFELVRATPHRSRQTGLLYLFPPFTPPRNRKNFSVRPRLLQTFVTTITSASAGKTSVASTWKSP